MDRKEHKDANTIKPGMVVETTKGDLGEEDVSKPKVTDVVRDQSGNVEKFIVKKGLVFKKELDIPVDRVRDVERVEGKVIIDAQEKELEDLSSVGAEELVHEKDVRLDDEPDLLDNVETTIPTVEAMRDMERHARIAASDGDVDQATRQLSSGFLPWFHIIGPGFLGGMAGNDASAVTSYSIDGAQNGFGHLWLLLLSTPLYQSVQFSCAKLGRVTQKGLAEILREHYGRPLAGFAALVLIVANVALISADLVAIGSGLQLITGINWLWFIIPIALILWYLTVYRNFETLKKIFTVMSLAFVVYFVTAILAHPDRGSVLFNTFVPHVDLNFTSVSSAVALLGATISPYNIFWQVQGEKEEKRQGTTKQKLRFAAVDIGVGVVSGNLIAYVIILSSAATLYTHHQSIATAYDAAQALVSTLGPWGKDLFAAGLIGAGLVAIPILSASTSYAVSGTVGWPTGLSKKPWQNEGFYLILTLCLVISVILAVMRLDPIKLIFWANVLNGVLAPILIVYLIIVGNNRKIMGKERLHKITNIGLVVTFLVMTIATLLLFYGLFTGQGG